MLIVAGVTVGAIFAIYFTRNFIIEEIAVPVTPIATGGGGTGGTEESVGETDPEAPAEEPMDEPIEETLDSLASVVETQAAVMVDDALDIVSEKRRGDNRTPGSGGGRGGGVGGGIGAGFGPGRGGPPEPRREVRFEPVSLLEYAQWLDFFGIELGVLGEDNKVHYAYNLSQSKPSVRVGEHSEEQRLYMIPTDSQFTAFDRQLATKAGIEGKGRFILQFYPPKAQAILIDLERRYAGARKPETIRSTVFRVTHKGSVFEFSVADQSYR